MVAGPGVQTYAEDRIAEMIQHKFDVLFDQAFWPQFCNWSTFTLDGTLGIVTTDLTNLLARFDDIQVIYRSGGATAIPKLSVLTFNPFNLTGTVPLAYDSIGASDTNRVSRRFNMWPKTATGDIVMRYRTKPDTFIPSDDIDFDDQALILGAVYDYLEDDGTNSNATQKFQNLFESRVSQLIDLHNSAPISLDPITQRPNAFTFTSL